MNINELLNYCKKHDMNLLNATFEVAGALNKDVLEALVQEMADLLIDNLNNADNALEEQLKEYHDYLFEE